jgi:hypothetical protein
MTDKQAPVIAYKGFDKDLKCRGYQFKVGETFEHTGEVKACKSGFHACENPLDILNYYDLCDSRFAIVEMSGEYSRHEGDSKIASAKISIKVELKLPEFIAASIDWVKQACNIEKPDLSGDKVQSASGNCSQLAASGNYSQLAASGDSSKLAASGYSSKLAASGYSSKLAASGDSSQLAASGNCSQLAASGNYSKLAASGNYSKLAASGKSSIAMAASTNCQAKAGELGCIALTRWVESEKRFRVSVAYVGENGIKADTFYRLDEQGNFVEAT